MRRYELMVEEIIVFVCGEKFRVVIIFFDGMFEDLLYDMLIMVKEVVVAFVTSINL